MYKRLCRSLNTKGELIPFNANVYDYIKNLNDDYYLSVYNYNEEQHKKFYTPMEKINESGEIYETINGVIGIKDVTTSTLIFDFDIDKHKGNSLEDVKIETVEAVNRLIEYGINEIDMRITFSGNKGFGITVELNQELNPDEHKNLAKNLMGDLDSWDSKVYNDSRILRIPYTRHQISKLFKLPIGFEELQESSIEEIQELASNEYDPDNYGPKIDLPVSLMEMAKTAPKREKVGNITLEGSICTLDFSKKPKWLSPWKYALSEGYFPPGTRSYALMILGATYASQGLHKITSYRMLKSAAELQSNRFEQDRFPDEEIWKNIIEQVYQSSWNGGTYSEDHFPDDLVDYLDGLGIPRTTPDDEDSTLIESINEGFDEFLNYATRIEDFTMKFGIPSLDEKLKVRKGHLIFMLAPPGVGKTSFAITLLNNMSKEGTGCYFGSYDMYKNNVYQKLIQRHTGLSEDELYDIFISKDEDRIAELRQVLEDEYKNVSFCYKVGQSVGDLKRSVSREEEKRGVPIDLVVVDYLELVLTDAKDPTAASAEAAQGLRELANEGRVVLCLLQPNKHSSTPDEPITSYNGAKGSSSIAQSGTAIITGHRPGISSENDNADDFFFGINCVKNRNGPLFSLDFGWEGSTQTIYELDDSGKLDLKKLRRKKEEKNNVGEL